MTFDSRLILSTKRTVISEYVIPSFAIIKVKDNLKKLSFTLPHLTGSAPLNHDIFILNRVKETRELKENICDNLWALPVLTVIMEPELPP
jgi:hypothetical protein